MAGRPLRPATDRRLGRPLPHQLPNRTQAAHQAHYCFDPQVSCGISSSFPELSPTQRHVPTRSSPVRHSPCEACDLHVLSMPPAFTLSQDQTLRFFKAHHQLRELTPTTPTTHQTHIPTPLTYQPSIRPPFPPPIIHRAPQHTANNQRQTKSAFNFPQSDIQLQ